MEQTMKGMKYFKDHPEESGEALDPETAKKRLSEFD